MAETSEFDRFFKQYLASAERQIAEKVRLGQLARERELVEGRQRLALAREFSARAKPYFAEAFHFLGTRGVHGQIFSTPRKNRLLPSFTTPPVIQLHGPTDRHISNNSRKHFAEISFGPAATFALYVAADGTFFNTTQLTATERRSGGNLQPLAGAGDLEIASQINPPRNARLDLSDGTLSWFNLEDAFELQIRSLASLCHEVHTADSLPRDLPVHQDSQIYHSGWSWSILYERQTDTFYLAWRKSHESRTDANKLTPFKPGLPTADSPIRLEELGQYIVRITARRIFEIEAP